MLEVFYDKEKVKSHQYLKPTGKPEVKYPFQPGKLYTLIMHDPDAPAGNVMHWVVVNLSSTFKGDELMKYRGPAPPPGSGIHRYIVLLYEQEEETGREIEIPHVIPMNELLELLGLQGSRLLSTVEFTSSYGGGGKKRRKKSVSRRRKKKKSRKKKSISRKFLHSIP
jgi:hypothetical protein